VTPRDPFAASLQKFEETRSSVESIDGWQIRGRLGIGALSEVKLANDPKRKVTRAVKTPLTQGKNRYLEWESAIHSGLHHPLIVGFEGYIRGTATVRGAIVTECVPNGSLADHLPSSKHSGVCPLTGDTRIAMIVVGTALGMRYLHSMHVIHRDLKPSNILIDWDWVIRIANFSHGLSADASGRPFAKEMDRLNTVLSLDGRYCAPECFEQKPTLMSDVFSFGSIVLELLTGLPGFSLDLTPLRLLNRVVLEKGRPAVPDFIAPKVRTLISRLFPIRPGWTAFFRRDSGAIGRNGLQNRVWGEFGESSSICESGRGSRAGPGTGFWVHAMINALLQNVLMTD
jgi:serine/threonine protein kinase